MKSFEARYEGRCAACGDRIEIGDDAAYDDDEVVHAYCVDEDETDLRYDWKTVTE
jgi:hypothetical protein